MSARSKRPPLDRDRVLDAALALADAEGLEALSMRRVGKAVGVEAMSLYNHVANKEELLDGLVERFVSEVELPRADEGWRAGMWRRAASARAAFRRHPWALTLLESRRNPGPATLRYHDAVLGCMLRDGFSIELAGHAFALVDAFVFGFAVQEATLPFENGADLEDVAADVQAAMPVDDLPHLAAMIAYSLRPGYAFAAEFDYGLTLILDGLEQRLSRAG